MLKKIYKIFIYLFISSLFYVIIIKLVEPPITITQLTNAFGLGLKRDYVSWNEISYNIKLAALASEDQSFTDHSGFDWDAIEKSLRPRNKRKKSKIPIGGGASTITQEAAENKKNMLVIDTDMYVMKVWCEYVFDNCHTFILEQINARSYDYYLLCDIDLPWYADEMREYPDDKPRQELFQIYKDLLINQNTPWGIVSGSGEERTKNAIQFIDKNLQK